MVKGKESVYNPAKRLRQCWLKIKPERAAVFSEPKGSKESVVGSYATISPSRIIVSTFSLKQESIRGDRDFSYK